MASAIGHLFYPADKDLLQDLLNFICQGSPLPKITLCLDFYQRHPSELPGLAPNSNGDNGPMYFLSRVKKRGTQVVRKGQNQECYWKPNKGKGDGKGKDPILITRSNGAVIRVTMTYMKYVDENNTGKFWSMIEYRLPDNQGSDEEPVICEVRYKGPNNFENHSGARDDQYHQPFTHNVASSSMMHEGYANMGAPGPTLEEVLQSCDDPLNWSVERVNEITSVAMNYLNSEPSSIQIENHSGARDVQPQFSATGVEPQTLTPDELNDLLEHRWREVWWGSSGRPSPPHNNNSEPFPIQSTEDLKIFLDEQDPIHNPTCKPNSSK